MLHIPIPFLLRGAEAGSFAEDTVGRRLPAMALRVVSENSFDEATNQRLRALANDLPRGRIRPLLDRQAPDWPDWQKVLQPFLGQSWLELPLFAAEMYFYRRILEATGYFQPGMGYEIDPYRLQKNLGLAQVRTTLMQALPQGLPSDDEQLSRLIHLSLWANQADLSLWPVQGEGGGKAQGGGGGAHLLADQSAAALKQIEELDGGRVELILDNFGTELIHDLLLADALLAKKRSLNIRIHVKPHPCFVSDAIAADIARALQWLKSDATAWARPAAERLEQAELTGRLQVRTHFYWASPCPAWEMPPDLCADLSGSVFMISKGDVNYRRWLGDARWPSTTLLEDIINPPAPLLLLRVSKSDVAAGLHPGQAEALRRGDPDWQLNGRWRMIQFVRSKKVGQSPHEQQTLPRP
jgi:hypothetical protein